MIWSLFYICRGKKYANYYLMRFSNIYSSRDVQFRTIFVPIRTEENIVCNYRVADLNGSFLLLVAQRICRIGQRSFNGLVTHCA